MGGASLQRLQMGAPRKVAAPAPPRLAMGASEAEILAQEGWRVNPAGYGERLGEGKWQRAPYLDEIGMTISLAVNGLLPPLVIITTPPRHGKSSLCSRYTPVWFLDHWPDRDVIVASYDGRLAQEMTGLARNDINQHPELLRVRVKGEHRAGAGLWRTTEGAVVLGTGVGGEMTGRGGGIIIVDDPFKNWQEAHSKNARDTVWGWWRSTVRTRRNFPDVVTVVAMTRWHEGDLVGRLTTGVEVEALG